MRTSRALAIVVLAAMPALAHRLDEYLQGTLLAIEKDRVNAEMTLTPGVAVAPFVMALIDTNADGEISEAEQRAYGARVLGDLSLKIDGQSLTPRLLSIRFPTRDDMKEGRGAIRLDFDADLPRGGARRKLTLENHHQSRIAAYQVNCLVPRDPDIRIVTQDRNESQSVYELEYAQAGADSSSIASWSRLGLVAATVLLLLARLGYFWRKRPRSDRTAI
jgi:hypothetical protein